LIGHRSSVGPLRRLALGGVGLAAAILLLGLGESEAATTPAPAAPNVIEVDALADADDDMCSLGEAVKAANDDAPYQGCVRGVGDDVINITAPGTINAPAEGFPINSNMTIKGATTGAGTTIDGKHGSGADAVNATEGFKVNVKLPAVTKVTIADLTISDMPQGKGVELALTYSMGDVDPFAVVLRGLHLVGVQRGVDTSGGAAGSLDASPRPGAIRVEDSLIEGSQDGKGESAIFALCHSRAAQDFVIDNSVIRGLGVSSTSDPVFQSCGRLKVVNSTISGNRGQNAGGIHYGGLGGSLELVNSTIAGNTHRRAAQPGGAVFVYGTSTRTGVAPSVRVVHSTIAGNKTAGTNAAGIVVGHDASHRADVTIENSVIADNKKTTATGTVAASQCSLPTGSTVTGSASSDDTCGFAKEDIDVADFKFEKDSNNRPKPAVNGNPNRIGPYKSMDPVKTIAFKAGSKLLDAADATACRGVPETGKPSRDARGVPRPQGPGCDIGAYEMIVPATLTGEVWVDENGNGTKDQGDSALAEATTVKLVDTSTGRVVTRMSDRMSDGAQATTTTADGEYRLADLVSGSYLVEFTLPKGYRFTETGDHSPVTSSSAGSSRGTAPAMLAGGPATVDAGAYKPVSVTGVVWVDSDGDGVRDSGEPGLKGVSVQALRDGSQAGSDETDANGAYEFSGLAPGSYVVMVTAPADYAFSRWDVGSDDSVDSDVDPASGRSPVLSLASGEARKVDAGMYRLRQEGEDPAVPAPLLSLVKTATGEAPVGAGDAISYSFLVRNAGNVTLSRVSVADPKAGVVSCPGTVLAPEGSMTCTASYEASAADAKAGTVANTATVTGSAADGAKVSATDSATFDLASGKPTVDRLAGKDRYVTAAVISGETFTPGVDVVYVATGVNFPDALAGSAASGGKGPILLVTKDSIPSATLTELKRLKPKRIVVLGGTGVVSEGVESALKRHATTTRQAGRDRYSTAAKISAEHFGSGAATAFVATGADFPDALTGGPAAAKAGGPILLTQKDKLPAATVSELRRLKPQKIVVLGGTGVVSAAVEKALASYTSGKVSRLAGADRYSTGGAISKDGFDQGAPVVYVATGLNFPDALAGGAAGALKDGPVLLVSGASIPKATKAELTRLKPRRVVVLGGEAVVPESVEKALAAYIR